MATRSFLARILSAVVANAVIYALQPVCGAAGMGQSSDARALPRGALRSSEMALQLLEKREQKDTAAPLHPYKDRSPSAARAVFRAARGGSDPDIKPRAGSEVLQAELGKLTEEWVNDRGRGRAVNKDLQAEIDQLIDKWTNTAVATRVRPADRPRSPEVGTPLAPRPVPSPQVVRDMEADTFGAPATILQAAERMVAEERPPPPPRQPMHQQTPIDGRLDTESAQQDVFAPLKTADAVGGVASDQRREVSKTAGDQLDEAAQAQEDQAKQAHQAKQAQAQAQAQL